MENLLYPRMWGQLLTICSNANEVAQCGAPRCSRPQQLPTMASETVDPIEWPPHEPLSSTYFTVEMLATRLRDLTNNCLNNIDVIYLNNQVEL